MYHRFLIYHFIINDSIQEYSLKSIVSSLYVHNFRAFRKYELFGDKSAKQSMAESCLPNSDLMFGEIGQKSQFIRAYPVK